MTAPAMCEWSALTDPPTEHVKRWQDMDAVSLLWTASHTFRTEANLPDAEPDIWKDGARR